MNQSFLDEGTIDVRCQFKHVSQSSPTCHITKNLINLDLIEIIQLWTFWTLFDIFYFNHLSPLQGYF